MFKVLMRLVAILVSFALLIAIVGSFLPRDYSFETTRDIKAKPEEIFAMINQLPNWKLWSNWNPERVPDLKIQYGEIKQGEGAVQTWTDSRGSGKLWIVESTPNQSLVYRLKFGQFPEMSSRIELKNNGDNTKVTWSSDGKLPDGPFYGYFAMIFPTQMRYEYEHNLQRLAEVVEQKP